MVQHSPGLGLVEERANQSTLDIATVLTKKPKFWTSKTLETSKGLSFPLKNRTITNLRDQLTTIRIHDAV